MLWPLNLNKVVRSLLQYVIKTGRYYIGTDHLCSISTKDSQRYCNLYPEASNYFNLVEKIKDLDFFNPPAFFTEYREFYTKERGLVEEINTIKQLLLKTLVSYQIQSIGAMTIKLAAKYIVSVVKQSKLLILVHDETIFDILDENELPIIQKAMKDAYFNMLNGNINIEVKKII